MLPLFNGSSAFGSRKRYCSPTTTELIFKTGFQSSLKIFKQTFPSRSILGWYICIQSLMTKRTKNKVNLLSAQHLGRFMWIVGIDFKSELECTTSIETYKQEINHRWEWNLPSSGEINRSKLKTSFGSGKFIDIVLGSLSISDKSKQKKYFDDFKL